MIYSQQKDTPLNPSNELCEHTNLLQRKTLARNRNTHKHTHASDGCVYALMGLAGCGGLSGSRRPLRAVYASELTAPSPACAQIYWNDSNRMRPMRRARDCVPPIVVKCRRMFSVVIHALRIRMRNDARERVRY